LDELLLLRVLEAKLEDVNTKADPTVLGRVRREYEELLVRARQTPIELER
jgi:hypothetical protein